MFVAPLVIVLGLGLIKLVRIDLVCTVPVVLLGLSKPVITFSVVPPVMLGLKFDSINFVLLVSTNQVVDTA